MANVNTHGLEDGGHTICWLIKSLFGFQHYGRNIQKHNSIILTRNRFSPGFLFLLLVVRANFTSCEPISLYRSIDDTRIAHYTTSGFSIDSVKSTVSAKCEVNSTQAEVYRILPLLLTCTENLQRIDSHLHNHAKLKMPFLMIKKPPAKPQATLMTGLIPMRSSRGSHTLCELSSRTDLIAIPSEPVPSCLHSPRASTISNIPTGLIDVVILHRHMINQDFHHCPLVEYRLQCTLTDLENLLATCPLRNIIDDVWFYEWYIYRYSSYTIDTFLLQNCSDCNILVIDHHKVFPVRIQFILFYAAVLTLACRSLAPNSDNLTEDHVAKSESSSDESDTVVSESDDKFPRPIDSVHSTQQVQNEIQSITQNNDSEIAGLPELPNTNLLKDECHTTLPQSPEPAPDNNTLLTPYPFLNQFGDESLLANLVYADTAPLH